MKVYTVHEVLEGTKKKLAEVTAERDALAAQVEVLRIALEATRQPHMDYIPKLNTTAAKVLEATPQQHLAEIRAEAGRAGFVAGAEWWARCELCDELHLDENNAAEAYAESMRKGGAK